MKIIIILFMVLFFILISYKNIKADTEKNKSYDFIPSTIFVKGEKMDLMDSVLTECKYSRFSNIDNCYIYRRSNPNILLRINFATGKIYKNSNIKFDIKNKFKVIETDTGAELIYIDENILSLIVNKYILASPSQSRIHVIDLNNDNNNWTNLNYGLITHATGVINGVKETDSLNALISTYNNGSRVIEIDFNLTNDNRLAVVHDWDRYSGSMSATKWKRKKIDKKYISMMLEDVYKMMYINQDMYIVTDTKSFNYSDDDAKKELEILVDTAKKIDPKILDRVIVQIYNEKMYDTLMKIYPFKNVIYTLYASKDSDRQVLNFLKDKTNIKVVTMGSVRYSEDFYMKLTSENKYIYFFTVNDIKDILKYKKMGIHGFYTDIVTPLQLQKILK